MRKFSLVLAAAAVVLVLAVSGSASAADMPSNYEILTKGRILHAAQSDNERSTHHFTVAYNDGYGTKGIYRCVSNATGTTCVPLRDRQ